MTLADRCEAFAAAFPNPAAHLRLVKEQGRDVAYGTWLLGNDYRNKTRYYGAYPPGYLDRVHGLFPDVHDRVDDEWPTLHVFSGSLPPGPYDRCDSRDEVGAEFSCDVTGILLESWAQAWALVIADPPYSKADAVQYQTQMIDRRRVLSALAGVTAPGGHLCWLDQVWPMHRKADWLTVARITVIRSTNHRVRMLTIFERTAA